MQFTMTCCMTLVLVLSGTVRGSDVVDGVRAPVPAAAKLAGTRIAPDVMADWAELPATVPIEGDAAAAPYMVAGYVEDAPDGLLDSPVWEKAPDGGWVYALELTSAGAQALRVRFDGGAWDSSLEFRVYDPVSGSAFGPYRRPHLDEDGRWWTTIIFGDSIGLEFYVPLPLRPKTRLPALGAIAYVWEPLPGTTLSACVHRDVMCEPDWIDTSLAVALLATIQNNNVVSFCSGALLNRSPVDLVPLVMTANHCVGGQSTAETTAYVWQFQTPSCNGMPPNRNNLPRSVGSLMLKRHTGTDWNLLGLYEPPGTEEYLGWSALYWEDGGRAVGIHHPTGSFKRFSLGTKIDDYEQEFCNGRPCFDAEIWEVEYSTGFTQGGSSGSPILDGSHHVRGTLSGGPRDECEISKYGRFDLAFVNLRYYLSDGYIASPVHVNHEFAGDPGNNGGLERGTLAFPFNTVHEATFAVLDRDDLVIAPGNYEESFTVSRPMTLKARQGGAVRIGK